MLRRLLAGVSLLSLLGLLLAQLPALAQGHKSDSEVKISATATKPDSAGRQTLTVTLIHGKGWHTYANPVGNDDFDSNKTVVTVLAKGRPVPAKIDYPAGKITKDKTVGDYRVYKDKVAIRANLQRASGDTSPLQVQVRIQACSDKGICLLPATVKLAVR